MFTRKWLQALFTTTKKDRLFGIVMIALVGGAYFLPNLFRKPPALLLEEKTALREAVDTLEERKKEAPRYAREENNHGYQYESSSEKSFTPGQLFQFDPNTATLNDWQRLGLNERTSKTIVKYTSKGGKFYKAEDLQKIWGMPEGFYERVKNYVTIAGSQRKNYTDYADAKPAYVREEKKPSLININNADTASFISLPGIGSKLSARIVSFRDKLGGFYSVDQVGETYGLPDSTFQKIKTRLQVSGQEVRKLNVNTASKDELKVHPYIKWPLANAIVEYRNQHGAFKTLEELKNIVLIDEAAFAKISHYVSL